MQSRMCVIVGVSWVSWRIANEKQSKQAEIEEGGKKIMLVSDGVCQGVNLLLRWCCADGLVDHWPDMYHADWVRLSHRTAFQCKNKFRQPWEHFLWSDCSAHHPPEHCRACIVLKVCHT